MYCGVCAEFQVDEFMRTTKAIGDISHIILSHDGTSWHPEMIEVVDVGAGQVHAPHWPFQAQLQQGLDRVLIKLMRLVAFILFTGVLLRLPRMARRQEWHISAAVQEHNQPKVQSCTVQIDCQDI